MIFRWYSIVSPAVFGMIMDVYIMDKNGVCLCRRTYGEITGSESSSDGLLLTGFMSAIMSFTEQIGEAKLEVIRTDKYLLLCNPSDSVAVIIIATGERERTVKEIANEILKRFKAAYAQELDHWDGNIEHFQSFSREIDDIINSKLERQKVKELILSGDADAKKVAELILTEIDQQLQKIMEKGV
ncbi:MAG: hypothetical protein KIH01_02995 [Candidatus Freyarchaeota archaeon]|nr:hypothetical protein [Candidatus Jordarchaeia archaeon]